MPKYYFVRHGESTANAKGLFAGFSDVELTEKGVQQAHDVAQAIAASDIWFDAVYISSLSRAVKTAEIITNKIHFPSNKVVVLSELRERNAGDLELAALKEVYEVSEEQMTIHGGETAEAFRVRVASVFETIREDTANMQNVLIVAHAGIYKMAEALNKDIQPATKAYLIPPPPNATLLPLPL